MNFFSIDQLPQSPWKNGGGTTREILSWPPGAGITNFDWRVSVATISSSGPFSRFDGVDRVIMLLDGDGVWLRGSKTDCHLDQAGKPFSFSGEDEIACELLGGESTDFNVMTRRGVASASVGIIDASCSLDALDGGLAMCLSGSWSIEQRAIAKWQGSWWTGQGGKLQIDKRSAAPAALILVSWIRL